MDIMDILKVGLVGIGTILLAIGIAVGATTLAVVGVVFLGVGILVIYLTKH
jgi:hypothetical protein